MQVNGIIFFIRLPTILLWTSSVDLFRVPKKITKITKLLNKKNCKSVSILYTICANRVKIPPSDQPQIDVNHGTTLFVTSCLSRGKVRVKDFPKRPIGSDYRETYPVIQSGR